MNEVVGVEGEADPFIDRWSAGGVAIGTDEVEGLRGHGELALAEDLDAVLVDVAAVTLGVAFLRGDGDEVGDEMLVLGAHDLEDVAGGDLCFLGREQDDIGLHLGLWLQVGEGDACLVAFVTEDGLKHKITELLRVGDAGFEVLPR